MDSTHDNQTHKRQHLEKGRREDRKSRGRDKNEHKRNRNARFLDKAWFRKI